MNIEPRTLICDFRSPTANIEVVCHSDGATNGSDEESHFFVKFV